MKKFDKNILINETCFMFGGEGQSKVTKLPYEGALKTVFVC